MSLQSLEAKVRRRAVNRCEYCHLPQAAFRRPFHIEHIIARQHGGSTSMENLALACWVCNLKKGTNLSAIDPETNQMVRLFDPRKDIWEEHFSIHSSGSMRDGLEIRGLTTQGRATVRLLGMNDDMRQAVRFQLWVERLFPA